MYSIYNKQMRRLMSVGRNSATKEDAKYDLLHYVSVSCSREELAALSKLTPEQVAARCECQIFKHLKPFPNYKEYIHL
jgi:hypothetical protein